MKYLNLGLTKAHEVIGRSSVRKKAGNMRKKARNMFVHDCEMPIADNYHKQGDFEQHMGGKIKVECKIGNLGSSSNVNIDADTLNTVLNAT